MVIVIVVLLFAESSATGQAIRQAKIHRAGYAGNRIPPTIRRS
jgi:hypothetical protein